MKLSWKMDIVSASPLQRVVKILVRQRAKLSKVLHALWTRTTAQVGSFPARALAQTRNGRADLAVATSLFFAAACQSF